MYPKICQYTYTFENDLSNYHLVYPFSTELWPRVHGCSRSEIENEKIKGRYTGFFDKYIGDGNTRKVAAMAASSMQQTESKWRQGYLLPKTIQDTTTQQQRLIAPDLAWSEQAA